LADARWIREERGRTGWLRAVHERPSPASPTPSRTTDDALEHDGPYRGAEAGEGLRRLVSSPAATLQTVNERGERRNLPPISNPYYSSLI
jgi:hypothetical protein